MKKYISLFLSLILIITVFTACGSNNATTDTNADTENNSKLSIVSTIFPYYDFARVIAGDKAEVTMLLSPGSESHDYEPSPQDIIKINEADIFIYNGGESDEWVEKILSSIDSDVKILKMFDYVTPICIDDDHSEEDGDDHKHSEYDEHIWTSLGNAVKFVSTISQEIISCDSDNEDYYTDNADLYIDDLYELDMKFDNSFVGGDAFTFVVADRFPLRYLADRYIMEYVSAFPGCSSETEPSIDTVTNIIDFVNENDIPVVFHMDNSNEKFAKLVAEDTGAKVGTLYSCENITKEQFSEGVTYFSLMEQNLNALMEAK